MFYLIILQKSNIFEFLDGNLSEKMLHLIIYNLYESMRSNEKLIFFGFFKLMQNDFDLLYFRD